MAINYKPARRNNPSELFQLTNGLDSTNDPTLIKKSKFIDCKNIYTTDLGFECRSWITTYWTQTGTAKINAQWVIKKESWDILVRVFWTKFQKLVTTTWTDVSTVSNLSSVIVSYNCSDLTTASLKSGTGTANSTTRTFEPSGGWMTINAYASKVLRITWGTGSGQEKTITSNDLTTLFIDWVFETTPDATSTYDIRAVAPHVIVTNGTDSVFKYDWTTLTTLSMPKFHSLEVQHDRLFWARRDLDYLYMSNLWTDFFPKDNYIPINQDWDIITQVTKNLQDVIVYKQNSRYRLIGYNEDEFQLIPVDTAIGCIAPKSVAHGNNWNFFLWVGWVYSINTLENSSTDEWLPLSIDINSDILAHTAQELSEATGWLINNRYHLSIWNEVFVYDIDQSFKKRTTVWTRLVYPENIVDSFINNWFVYLGSATKTYIVWGSTDDGVYFACDITTGKKHQWDKNVYKIYERDYINWKALAKNVTISVWVDEWSLVSQWAFSMSTGQIRLMNNKRWRYLTYKYEFTSEWSPSFISHETFYNPLPKVI